MTPTPNKSYMTICLMRVWFSVGFYWGCDLKLIVKTNRLSSCKSRLSSPVKRKECSARSSWGRGRGGRPWRRLREAVLLRDKYTCQYCGRASAEGMEVDHILNRASGGTDELSNLQTLCKSCHQLKTRRESLCK